MGTVAIARGRDAKAWFEDAEAAAGPAFWLWQEQPVLGRD